MLFLAMQVRVMAACMESQADILECTASAQSGRREVMVCFSPMSMGQGNIFRSVSQELCPLGGGACMAGGMHGRGACMAGGMHGRGVCVAVGGMCSSAAYMAGGMHDSGVCVAWGYAWWGCAWHSVHIGMHGRGHAWQGGMHGSGVCMAGGTHGRGHVWQGCVCGRGHVWQEGMQGGGACAWHAPTPADTTRYGHWAGGTHPTGMHSCFLYFTPYRKRADSWLVRK